MGYEKFDKNMIFEACVNFICKKYNLTVSNEMPAIFTVRPTRKLRAAKVLSFVDFCGRFFV